MGISQQHTPLAQDVLPACGHFRTKGSCDVEDDKKETH